MANYPDRLDAQELDTLLAYVFDGQIVRCRAPLVVRERCVEWFALEWLH